MINSPNTTVRETSPYHDACATGFTLFCDLNSEFGGREREIGNQEGDFSINREMNGFEHSNKFLGVAFIYRDIMSKGLSVLHFQIPKARHLLPIPRHHCSKHAFAPNLYLSTTF
ncbi:hypothetical protein XELAEV_18011049mg [Xenopus laevis]|uniref:Uncharacterized protein n=1 Tax=Xenopus laevis TaxID=8355 RepID=A0A974DVC5_XENLA|nr:hypothetical protein XELAEV_18011049mg [Xenopus laevis]